MGLRKWWQGLWQGKPAEVVPQETEPLRLVKKKITRTTVRRKSTANVKRDKQR